MVMVVNGMAIFGCLKGSSHTFSSPLWGDGSWGFICCAGQFSQLVHHSSFKMYVTRDTAGLTGACRYTLPACSRTFPISARRRMRLLRATQITPALFQRSGSRFKSIGRFFEEVRAASSDRCLQEARAAASTEGVRLVL